MTSVRANLVHYSPAPGRYALRSAAEAWQAVLLPYASTGMLEGVHGAGKPIKSWQRDYPRKQPVTIYGRVSAIQSVSADKAPFIQIDSYPVTGQVGGLAGLARDTYVQATGQFIKENGIEKFEVEAWQTSGAHEDGFQGTLRRENDSVTLTTLEGEQYALADVPASVPMPFEDVYVIGTLTGKSIAWKSIDDRLANGNGGGGGGGGLGFYKLNLSGTPVPFERPTPPVIPTQAPSGRRVEGLRGFLLVTLYKRLDGPRRAEYGLTTDGANGLPGSMMLEGADLDGLQSAQNRPVDIWGTLDHYDRYGTPVIKVERYEIPYPDLKFQTMRGTQKTVEIQGRAITIFTAEDGTDFVQMTTGGMQEKENSILGAEGDPVYLEALVVPGETFAGYPVLRMFSGSVATGPNDGQLEDPATILGQPMVQDEMPAAPSLPTTATVEKVELVYYLSKPRYTAAADPQAGPAYIQPAWRFYGHYSNGDEFEILVQALKDEFLLPELAPFNSPG